MAEVLPVQVPDGQSYFSPSPLRRSSPSQTSFLVASPASYSPRPQPKFPVATEHNEYTSPLYIHSPSASPGPLEDQPPRKSALKYSTRLSREASVDYEEEEEISFPVYDASRSIRTIDDEESPASPTTESSYVAPSSGSESVVSTNTSSTPEPLPTAEDDTAIKHEPSRHVDYLSHEWREEDIWSSWRHITANRKLYGQRSRLENASWRTWAKQKYGLKTVSPETLNWLKDCDVTWLYGPLQTAKNTGFSHHTSETNSRISKNNSFLNKKPILKKRSMSEVMLQRSISASSLLKTAAAAVQAQQDPQGRPSYVRSVSEVPSSMASKSNSQEATDYFTSSSTSGLQTPEHGEKKHIRFDDKVEQCIAVDCKDHEYDDFEETWANQGDDDDDSSDDGIEIKLRSRRPSRTSSRTNFGPENKTIAKLPDTTLKYRTDSPDVPEHTPAHSLCLWRSSRLSPSPSQETLRPSRPSRNFLLGEDDDDDDISWEPSGGFTDRRDSGAAVRHSSSKEHEEEIAECGGLRRTPSGMFMPYEEDEDDVVAAGLFGRVVDTVNTAKDIAHVIWNVGWRS